jgi:8-oxo-dGTP diphosphatase
VARPGFPHEVLAVVFQVREEALCVLLWRRGRGPFPGRWALPGGGVGATERLGASVARHLAEKVDVAELAHLEQLETRSDPGRDPRGRELATAYLGLIPSDQHPHLPDDTQWHDVAALPAMAFDHGSIIASAQERLRAKLSYTSIGFALVPPRFTVSELRTHYTAALGYPVSATNLQRVLLRRAVIRPTEEAARPGPTGGRPARRFEFTRRAVWVTDPGPALRPPGSD